MLLWDYLGLTAHAMQNASNLQCSTLKVHADCSVRTGILWNSSSSYFNLGKKSINKALAFYMTNLRTALQMDMFHTTIRK